MRNGSNNWLRNALCSAAVAGLMLGTGGMAFAQSHSGGEKHDGGKSASGDHGDAGSDSNRKGGQTSGRQGGNGGKDLRDVFKQMEDEAAAESSEGKGQGQGSKGGKSSTAGSGSKGSATSGSGHSTDKGTGKSGSAGGSSNAKGPKETEEDSDRPDYAGPGGRDNKPGRPNLESGTKKGDIYGDMYVILRDENGAPILDANGYVQVKYTDASGNLQCCILRDAEGNLLPTLADGTSVLPIEIELGRLSVGRSPTGVLAAQYEEAITSINESTAVSLDPSGRIVVTAADGTEKTIDSPLENLALYYELITTGTLGGVDTSKLGDLAYLADGTLTAKDLAITTSFFAAASDKTIPVTVDSIEYMNSILGIEGSLDGYVDYTSFTYDRASVYGSMTTTVLQQESEGVWKEVEVNVYDAVFNSQATGELTNVSAFTTATDDARAVINYLHEYSVPTTE